MQAALAASFSRPFEYGVSDCVLAAADALASLGYPDYAEGMRGYPPISVMRKAREIGMDGVIEDAFSIAGLARVMGPPEICDVGVSYPQMTTAVFDGTRWWAKGSDGMVRVPAPKRIWRP